jgi:pyruvate dehydrogenase E2 component (dihydrolipoamide acetyltransferase)
VRRRFLPVAIFNYKLPELGEGLHEGEVVKWHIKPGDAIEEDQVIMEVQNDKAVVEVPSPVSGKIVELKVEEGTLCVVGDVLATIEVEGDVEADAEELEAAKSEETVKADKTASENKNEAIDNASAQKKTAEDVRDTDSDQSEKTDGGTRSDKDTKTDNAGEEAAKGKVLATPSVRKLAREQEVPLAKVKATGKNGRITREDVMSYDADASESINEPSSEAPKEKQQQSQAPAAQQTVSGDRVEERVPLKGIRKVIANAMVKSVYTAPHVTIMDEVDVSKLVELRTKAKPLAEQKGVKLTYLPFIVKALVAAARQFPVMNASIDDEKNEIVYKKYFNVGIAADTENGLVVPVVKDADRKNIWTIASEIKDLAVRARDGKLAPDEMKGSTITITNIGSAGGMFFTPVINHPEVAILGTGRISEKPVVRDGELAIGQVMALSLSFDHRIIDGATAQYAVNLIKQLLEDPQLLVMEV